MNIYKQSLAFHKKYKGKITIRPSVPIKTRHTLSLAYTPGVAQVSRVIAKNPRRSFDLTWRGRAVAVISDGSAVLGLGNIGPEAAIPVMEGKALLLKQFGGVDGIPIVVNSQDPLEIIQFVRHIAPSFAGINLEDISAPKCFQIEEALQSIGIPVFHDDQHGTAIVVTAALHNAATVVHKPYSSLRVIIVGAGSAGLAVTKMLKGLDCACGICTIRSKSDAVADVIVVDKKGALVIGRSDMNIYKQAIAAVTNKEKRSGSLSDVIQHADVVIGVSGPNTITPRMIMSMAKNPIVFTMANPTPEIMPDAAYKAGAFVVATGRSDLPNQINNVLAFPGIFRAVIDGKLSSITIEMKEAAVQALASLVTKPTSNNIIPEPFYPKLAEIVAKAVLKSAKN